MLRGSHQFEKWLGVLAMLLSNACDANSTSSENDGIGGAGGGSNATGGMAGIAPGNQESNGGAATSSAGTGGSELEMAAGGSADCTSTAPVSVSGSIRGPKVDAVIGDAGLLTQFLGPGASVTSEYGQTFYGGYPATGDKTDPFVFRMPADVVTASLNGWAAGTAAKLGTYSAIPCSRFLLELSFPIPPNVVCPTEFGPCGTQCEPSGELAICVPGHPKTRYRAELGGSCSSSGTSSAVGDSQLELTSVCPKPADGTLIHFETHGHLSATLVNDADASDQVDLNLDF